MLITLFGMSFIFPINEDHIMNLFKIWKVFFVGKASEQPAAIAVILAILSLAVVTSKRSRGANKRLG